MFPTMCVIGIAGSIACLATQVAPPKTAPPIQSASREVWHLTFRLSGGFAGMDRELDLANTGELKVTDRRRGTQVTARAAAGELSQIASLVADLKSADPVRETNCRDCLQYDLSVQRSEGPLVFRVNDVSLAGSPAQALVKVLSSLLNRELSQQPNRQGQ